MSYVQPKMDAHKLVFQSVQVSGLSVEFSAFITGFSDNFISEWERETVYGRMDPIQTFKNTRREISIEWALVAGSGDEAYTNMNKVSKLSRMLYPATAKAGYGVAVTGTPLIMIKLDNLISNTDGTDRGLFGSVDGFNYVADVEAGWYEGSNFLFPRVYNLSCTFHPSHTHVLGHGAYDKTFQNNFPYNPKGLKSYGGQGQGSTPTGLNSSLDAAGSSTVTGQTNGANTGNNVTQGDNLKTPPATQPKEEAPVDQFGNPIPGTPK